MHDGGTGDLGHAMTGVVGGGQMTGAEVHLETEIGGGGAMVGRLHWMVGTVEMGSAGGRN